MTALPAAAVGGLAAPAHRDGPGLPAAAERLERLVALLDPSFLEAVGWNPATQVLSPPPKHPQLGRRVCLVAGCGVQSSYRNGLCQTCQERYRSSGLDLEVFTTIRRVRVQVQTRASSTLICTVAQCPRPVDSAPAKLCTTHAAQRDRLGLALPVFLTHPQVRALPSFGDCRVLSCAGQAGNRCGLCRAHDSRWRRHRRHDPDLDFDRWCQTQPRPWIDATRVVLAGLPPLVQTELLYGLQERCRRGSKTKPELLRTLCELLRNARVESMLAFSTSSQLPWSQHTRVRTLRRQDSCALAGTMQTAVRQAFSSPELERRKHRWDMTVFGLPGTLDFTRISQSWLRQAVMDWATETAPTRQGRRATVTLQATVNSLELLSASLRRHRADHGLDPTLVGRADLVAFLNRLGQLHADGQLSSYLRRRTVRETARLLREGRELGLTRPGRPLAGLADDFALRPGDVPQMADQSEEGRALPPFVLEQLVAALPVLEQRSRPVVRVAVQLLIDTGRRPDEVCSLRWDCLEQDPDGKHALIYSDYKNRHLGRRLAITDQTARLIGVQQQVVRAQFPDTPVGELALLPSSRRNPHGTRSITEGWLARLHRDWVDGLPELLAGRGQRHVFDKAKVFLYAYRHSYAQRHADAGTPVDELRELMGHDSMTTTQGYYRVTAKRTRAAVDRLAVLQFDGRGNRSWGQARALLEHEHQRLAVGQVAVPFGICTEPSNVQAGGGACPFRFRCVGCGHFRSDPSYLPELRGYLELLLRNRERVRAAVELEDWARAEAMPSEEEIGRVRALIRRVETDLEQLTDHERAQIDAACQVVRATRQTVHLGMPTIGPPDPDPALEGAG
jgi:integrase